MEFAKRKGCEIILLNVCHFIYHSTSRLDSALAQIEQYSKKMIRSTISKIKEKGEYSDVPVKGINMLGNFSISVSEISQKYQTGLIIMGTIGASGINKMLLGSNTTEVVKNSKLPVLIVPENAVNNNFEEIIYAIDYKEDNLTMIKEMLDIISSFNIKVSTVHIAKRDTLDKKIQHRAFIKLLDEVFPDSCDLHQLIFNASVFVGM
ncbi:MAG: universal stress protein [Bacteroidota bacterium]|nr:universal stress protein [Bacteroidota bacterium]